MEQLTAAEDAARTGRGMSADRPRRFADLRGRVALVTGAGAPDGIGFAAARALAQQGASVAITSTTSRIVERAQELASLDGEVVGLAADLSRPEAATALVEAVADRLGDVDVLVNNAGLRQLGMPENGRCFLDLDVAGWQAALDCNLMTAVHATRAVLPSMIRRRHGRIVFVSSVTGPHVADPGDAGYATGKAAMEGLMRTIAVEYAGRGITANAVAPGWVSTASSTPRELTAGTYAPVGRPGTPREVAAAIVFLASDESSYVTGHSLVVDGGNVLQEHKGPRDPVA